MRGVQNNPQGIIRIEKRSPYQWLAMAVLLLPFTFGTLIQLFHLPDVVRFAIDAILIVFFAGFLLTRRMHFRKNVAPLIMVVALFVGYAVVMYLFRFQSPFYFLWGARNTFRYYIAFFAFVSYLSRDDGDQLLKVLDILFWADVIVSLFQFIFMGVRQDFLGGLFGVEGATNGYTLMFFSIIIVKSLLATFNQQEKLSVCILKCIAALTVAAMAELKFFFLLFVVLLLLTFMFTRFTWKKLIVLLVSVVALIVGATLLESWFGFEGFFTIEGLLELALQENYASEDDIGRLTAIATLMRDIVRDPVRQIFGMGLGNCDASSISLFNSPFYQTYGSLHYTWFTVAMLFLEVGFVGIGIYGTFFVVCMVQVRKLWKNNQCPKLHYQLAMIVAILCFLFTFYNESLRTEAGYMAYFILALPFLSQTQKGSMS